MRRSLASITVGAALTASLALTGCGSGSSSTSKANAAAAAREGIEQIEVNWHKASSTKDVDLMMSLWATDATFTVAGTTYTGANQIRAFFAKKSKPFMVGTDWESDTPAYKERVTVAGDKGTLYFECHYVDVATRAVAAVVSADNDVARVHGHWVITNSVAATPVLAP